MLAWTILRRRFETAIPVGAIDIDGQDFDAMLLCIAHDLRRRIEAHGLAVDEGRRKNIRIVAFDPGRGIDQDRKACRVTFRKAVFAKAFDLAETARGEIRWIAAPGHAVDEFGAEAVDGAD